MAAADESQRASTNASLERMIENNSYFDSSDEDAPEEITFEDSKRSALQIAKESLEAKRREKEALKEKRRKKQELFLEQKKRRLLPDSVLEEIDVPAATTREDEPVTTCQNEDDREISLERSNLKPKKVNLRSLEANCSVATLKGLTAGVTRKKEALAFIHSRLYGEGTRRTTNNELLSLEGKRGVHKKAAFQFVNKKMSPEDRLRATKGNKRWMRKKKLIGS